MEEKKTPTSGHAIITRKDILKTIIEQLHLGLSSLKEQLGEKKFEKRIKKAAKLLVSGIEKNPAKKPIGEAKKVVVPANKPAVIAKEIVAPVEKSLNVKKVVAPVKKAIKAKKAAAPAKKAVAAKKVAKKVKG